MSKKLLIISFSPIARDARVLKQVRLFTPKYEVTTCGFGPAPEGVKRHLELTHATLPGKTWDVLLELKAYKAGYWLMPDVRNAAKALKGLKFDAILADDIDTVPLALSLRPRLGVHADIHEYFPRLQEEQAPWAKRIGPWYLWLCQRYLPRCQSVTTVSKRIAQEYEVQTGAKVGVVTNATPYWQLNPTPVAEPIRLVHSGTSHRERNIEAIVDGVIEAGNCTLDLYLTPNDPEHLEHLKQRAQENSAITVHPPVPYEQLIETLNGYDLGVHLLPPINFNFANALPNKLFDFVQARLGVVVGPSPEMARIVEEAGLGVVAPGYSASDLAQVLKGLTKAQVQEFKAASHAHARELSADSQLLIWERYITKIMGE